METQLRSSGEKERRSAGLANKTQITNKDRKKNCVRNNQHGGKYYSLERKSETTEESL